MKKNIRQDENDRRGREGEWVGGVYSVQINTSSQKPPSVPFSKFFSHESDLHIVNYAIMHLPLL